jgi:SAM-dependent methyltransferase
MTTAFKDHFSSQSSGYAHYRPDYPAALFEYLAELAPDNARAWDCATGTGQAALGLARYFKEVIATDASGSQVSHAIPHERVIYRVAAAEKSGLSPKSVDLVVVAQALHWFDLGQFYQEVRRVVKPCGILAAWSYNRLRVEPEIDAYVEELYSEILGAYWPPERRMVEQGYAGLEFPFRELAPPDFQMSADWSLDHLLGYLRTWSAAERYARARGHDPIDLVKGKIQRAWGDPRMTKRVLWPLSMRVGVVEG